MTDRKTTFAVLAALLMVGWAAAPVAAAAGDATFSVGVSQDDTGAVTVSVTETADNNTTAVEGATVTVEVLDENATYDGAGTYVNATDGNGTLSLPEPNSTVNVSVTAKSGDLNATTETQLAPVENTNETDDNETDAFGQQVSSFVAELQNDSNVTRLGPLVASFVVENNPGDAPDHAGPPEWLVNSSEDGETGPPDWAGPPGDDDGNETDGEQGPPDDRGPPDDDDDKGGPPDDRGPPDDDDDKGGPPDDKGGPPDDKDGDDDEDDDDEDSDG